MRSITVKEKEGTIIFHMEDKYDNVDPHTVLELLGDFINKECTIQTDERPANGREE